MANVNNNWIGFLERSASQIKVSLLSRVTSSNPELTDHSESNIFIIILDMLSGIAEMIGYYIDNVAREAFMFVATRRSSIINHAQTMDYRVKARSAETVDVTLTWLNASDVPTVTPSAFTLIAGTYVENASNTRFVTIADIAIAMGEASSLIPFTQATAILESNLGVTDGSSNQELSLGSNYHQGSAIVVINGQTYTEVETFSNTDPTQFAYIIEIKIDGNAYLVFGNGVNGIIPPAGENVIVTYRTTLGSSGKVGAGKLTVNLVLLGQPASVKANSTNLQNSSGGSDYELDESIRTNATRSVKLNNRMVTRADYEDQIIAVAGVARAKVDFDCGKDIDIYIVPSGGGIASTQLISDAQDEADLKKMVTTFPVILPAGEARIVIALTATAKIREDPSLTKTDIENALVTYGSVDNQLINGDIRLSDIQALVDNLAKVDFVNLTVLYIIPYARPLNHNNGLDWDNQTLPTSLASTNWRLVYVTVGTEVQLFREFIFEATITVGAEYITNDGTFKFTVNAGAYNDGDTWNFTTYNYLKDVVISDFSIAKVEVADLSITVV